MKREGVVGRGRDAFFRLVYALIRDRSSIKHGRLF